MLKAIINLDILNRLSTCIQEHEQSQKFETTHELFESIDRLNNHCRMSQFHLQKKNLKKVLKNLDT